MNRVSWLAPPLCSHIHTWNMGFNSRLRENIWGGSPLLKSWQHITDNEIQRCYNQPTETAICFARVQYVLYFYLLYNYSFYLNLLQSMLNIIHVYIWGRSTFEHLPDTQPTSSSSLGFHCLMKGTSKLATDQQMDNKCLRKMLLSKGSSSKHSWQEWKIKIKKHLYWVTVLQESKKGKSSLCTKGTFG